MRHEEERTELCIIYMCMAMLITQKQSKLQYTIFFCLSCFSLIKPSTHPPPVYCIPPPPWMNSFFAP